MEGAGEVSLEFRMCFGRPTECGVNTQYARSSVPPSPALYPAAPRHLPGHLLLHLGVWEPPPPAKALLRHSTGGSEVGLASAPG